MNIPDELITLQKHLSLSTATFSKLRKDDLVYVDKTTYIERLVRNSGTQYVFLSRPRRFGKSLLLNTIGELFKGSEELFRGLYIHDKWDWSETFPVIHLDLSDVTGNTAEEIEDGLLSLMREVFGLEHAISIDKNQRPMYIFKEALIEISQRENSSLVILIDEYDIPILSTIMNKEECTKTKRLMHDFYQVIKKMDKHIRFVMLTGISKFSGVSVFSALNNLVDISLDPKYSAICGYTEEELDTYFEPFMKVVERNKFREMYNGYNWLGESVYNPIDVMKAITYSVSMKEFDYFRSFWFETGTPTFLVNLMKERGVLIPDLNENGISKDLFSEIDINYLSIEALLFQTGYLTIESKVLDEKSRDFLFRLKYPNKEVERSYSRFFLKEVFKEDKERKAFNHLDDELFKAFKEGDCQKIFDEIHRFFASLSYRWYSNNKIADAEGFYCGILYAICRSNAGYIESESQTNHGQIDLFIKVGKKRYIIEVKVRENAKGINGLDQIIEKGYADKYNDDSELYLIGMEFSSEERNIVKLEYCIGVGGERIVIPRFQRP